MNLNTETQTLTLFAMQHFVPGQLLPALKGRHLIIIREEIKSYKIGYKGLILLDTNRKKK